jgi:hypothetical protein
MGIVDELKPETQGWLVLVSRYAWSQVIKLQVDIGPVGVEDKWRGRLRPLRWRREHSPSEQDHQEA